MKLTRKIVACFLVVLLMNIVFLPRGLCEMIDELLSDKSKSAIELLTTIYTDEELQQINALNDITLKELNKLYPVQCLKHGRPGEYIILYRSEKKLLGLLIDDEGRVLKTALNIRKFSCKSEDFQAIQIGGSSFWTVREFDANGDYAYFSIDGYNVPRVSIHYTIDGYRIGIWYDEDYIVESIEIDLL